MTQDLKMQRTQEATLCTVARQTLDDGRPLDALLLVQRMLEFWSQNLITIMGALEYDLPPEKHAWALALLTRELKRATRAKQLEPAALWARNPKRAWLPIEVLEMLDSQRKSLEPDWDGFWQDPGREGSRMTIARFAGRCPEEVFDQDVCLDAANQVAQADVWLNRFLAIGGNSDDPRYLKSKVATSSKTGRPLSAHARADLRRFSEQGKVSEVRRFLTALSTPRTSRTSHGNIHRKTSEYALLVYCSCERLEHDANDWLHIAEGALRWRNPMMQRVAQRGLASLQRTPAAQRVFEQLVALNGVIPVTEHAKEDVGLRGNPIWDDIYTRLPVDANARSILLVYSKRELDAF